MSKKNKRTKEERKLLLQEIRGFCFRVHSELVKKVDLKKICGYRDRRNSLVNK